MSLKISAYLTVVVLASITVASSQASIVALRYTEGLADITRDFASPQGHSVGSHSSPVDLARLAHDSFQTRLVKRSPVPGLCWGKPGRAAYQETPVIVEQQHHEESTPTDNFFQDEAYGDHAAGDRHHHEVSPSSSHHGEASAPPMSAEDRAVAYGHLAQDYGHAFGNSMQLLNELKEHGEEAAHVREEVANKAFGELISTRMAKQERKEALEKLRQDDFDQYIKERDEANFRRNKDAYLADLAAQRARESNQIAE